MDEWLTLKQAADVLGLKSIKQVRRRLGAEKWRTRLNSTKGFMAIREVSAEDVNSSKRTVSEKNLKPSDIIHVPGDVPADVRGMSQVVKDFLGVANSIKDSFGKMIESQNKIVDAQGRVIQTEENRLKLEEKRFEIEKRRFKIEKIKSVIWAVLFTVSIGGLCAGAYYGYERLVNYYRNESSVRDEKIGVLDGSYSSILERVESREKQMGERDAKIQVLEEEIEKLKAPEKLELKVRE